MTSEKPLSEKMDFPENMDYLGRVFKVKDVVEALERLKSLRLYWVDIAIWCKKCDEKTRLWVHDKDHCYDCEVKEIFGDLK